MQFLSYRKHAVCCMNLLVSLISFCECIVNWFVWCITVCILRSLSNIKNLGAGSLEGHLVCNRSRFSYS